MDISVRTNISKELETIDVLISAPSINSDVQNLINRILSSNDISEISGVRENEIFIINIADVVTFYSEEKDNYCKTKDGVFKIKERLYQLEETLPQNKFIRISSSTIINVDHVKSFDVSLLGRIVVKFKDNTYDYVAKRRISEVMKFLKGGRG